jgi:hypothetical protein
LPLPRGQSNKKSAVFPKAGAALGSFKINSGWLEAD